MPNFLPNHRLLARALQRTTTATPSSARTLATTTPLSKWSGRPAEEHIAREQDGNNVQIDAAKDAKQERSKGPGEGNSRATNEGSGGQNKKAKEEFPEAPDTIGMQDERGGKGR